MYKTRMKTTMTTLTLLALSLAACKGKEIVEEHPPTKRARTSVLEAPSELKGEWERCEADLSRKKSVKTKLTIGNFIEIRETVYRDEFCQGIESTREKTLLTSYDLEMDGIRFKTTAKNRKLTLFNKDDVTAYNAKTLCHFTDWKERKAKEILGVPCSDVPPLEAGAVSSVIVTKKGENLLFGSQEFHPKEDEALGEANLPRLKNMTDSEVQPETGGKNVMLVFPPVDERFSVDVITPEAAKLKNCESLISTYTTALNSSARIRQIKSDIVAKRQDLAAAKEEVNKAVQDMVTFIEQNKLQEYDELNKQYDDLETEITATDEAYDQCESDCAALKAKLKELKEQKRVVSNKIGSLGIPKKTVRAYNSYTARIEELEKSVEKRKDAIAALEKTVQDAEDRHLKMFEGIGATEATKGTLKFESRWPQNLSILLKANPKYKFRYADLRKIVLTYKLSGIENYPAGESIMNLPKIEGQSLVKGRINFEKYPLALGGEVKLSHMAACPAVRPDDFKLKLQKPKMLEFEMSFSYKKQAPPTKAKPSRPL